MVDNSIYLLDNPRVHQGIKDRIILAHKYIDFNKRILEISPGFVPLVTASDIARNNGSGKVTHTDRISTRALIRLNRSHRDRIAMGCKVMEIDFVWKQGSSLIESSNGKKYDIVTSSHVVEHIPDFLGHFIEVRNVLNKDGSYVFILPNPLGTGEYFRRPSVLSDVINSFFKDKYKTSPGQNWEYITRSFHYTGGSIKNKVFSDFKRRHTDAEAIQFAARCQREYEYIDVHCWCFSPENFSEVWQELTKFNLNPFILEKIIPSEHVVDDHPMEYTVILRRNNDFHLPESWVDF